MTVGTSRATARARIVTHLPDDSTPPDAGGREHALSPAVPIVARRRRLDTPPGAAKVRRLSAAPLAQLAEQLTLNQRVPGSSPGWRISPSPRQTLARAHRRAFPAD